MAITGLMLIAFVIAHLLGNLQIFSGQEALNDYSELLKKMPKLLWTARIGLIIAFVLHMWTSITLSLENRAARPIPYGYKKNRAATLASRTMLLGGIVVLAFLLYHLAHFTLGLTAPADFARVDSHGRQDVYAMVILGFQNVYVATLYIIAQIALAMHISHGFGSVPQTLGLTKSAWVACFRRGGPIFAVVLALLYMSIPISVWLGVLQCN